MPVTRPCKQRSQRKLKLNLSTVPQLHDARKLYLRFKMEHPEGVEPPTSTFVVSRSVQLSYGCSLKLWDVGLCDPLGFRIPLRAIAFTLSRGPRHLTNAGAVNPTLQKMVGTVGFEPTTACSQNRSAT